MTESEVKIEVEEEESSKNVETEAASVSFDDDSVSKTELATAATLKMSPEELNSFFSHEIFGPPSKGHDCIICGRSFQFRYQLAVHAKYHTLPNESGEGEEDKDWQIKEEESSESSMYAIGTLPPCSATPALSLSISNATAPNPKNHICTVCGRGFSRKEHLTNHMNRHNGISPHECHLCPKRFSRKDHLDSHIKAHDSDFKCHVCQKTFSRKEHLVAHVQWHTGASPHRCNHCKKAFTRREHLIAHVRQHTGESPHVCRFCSKSFTRKEHVVNHERSHTGETPFKCTVCPRAFTRRDHLVVHTRQHTGETPYKCKECNKSFTRKEHLVNHSRQHAGGSYKCHFCPKLFAGKDVLTNHINSHLLESQQVPAPPLPLTSVVPNEPLLLQTLNSKNTIYNFNFQEQLSQARCEYTCEICAKSFQLQNNLMFHHMTAHALGY